MPNYRKGDRVRLRVESWTDNQRTPAGTIGTVRVAATETQCLGIDVPGDLLFYTPEEAEDELESVQEEDSPAVACPADVDHDDPRLASWKDSQ